MATLKVTNIKNESFAGDQLYLKTDGKIGIGTATPDKEFHLERNDTSTSAIAKFKNAGTGDATLQIGTAATNFVIGMDNSDSDKFKLGYGSVLESMTGMTIDSSGKVGIGTTSPSSKLDIHCGSDNTGLQITSTDAGAFASYFDNTGASTIGHSGTDLVLSCDPAGSVGSSNIVFQVDSNNERMRITSTGSMGLGTSSNIDERVHFENAGNITLLVECSTSGSGSNSAVRLKSADSSSDWYMQTGNATSGALRFYSGSERMKIDTSGHVTINDGNLVIGTSGHGIDFSAQTPSSATGASNTAEVLDHYEEGTWTPVLTSGFTYATLSASYTRIGNVVNVYFNMYRDDSGTYSGDIDVTGLPFAIASTSIPFTNSMGLGIAASYNGSSDRRIGFINANNANSVRVVKAGTTAHVSYDDFVANTRAFTMKWWYYTA